MGHWAGFRLAKVMAGIQANQFSPAVERSALQLPTEAAQTPITSENELEPLRLGAEAREIQEELRASEGILFSTSLAVTPRTTIVHFSGHGTNEGLCLETETGQLKTVNAEALGRLFAVFDDSMQCLFLNACYSEMQAKAIGQHIPYVIGMQRSIGDEAAIAFSATFW